MAKFKLKGFSGIKKCSDGEVYYFHNGLAIVPGVKLNGQPVHITLADFKKLQEGSEDEEIT